MRIARRRQDALDDGVDQGGALSSFYHSVFSAGERYARRISGDAADPPPQTPAAPPPPAGAAEEGAAMPLRDPIDALCELAAFRRMEHVALEAMPARSSLGEGVVAVTRLSKLERVEVFVRPRAAASAVEPLPGAAEEGAAESDGATPTGGGAFEAPPFAESDYRAYDALRSAIEERFLQAEDYAERLERRTRLAVLARAAVLAREARRGKRALERVRGLAEEAAGLLWRCARFVAQYVTEDTFVEHGERWRRLGAEAAERRGRSAGAGAGLGASPSSEEAAEAPPPPPEGDAAAPQSAAAAARAQEVMEEVVVGAQWITGAGRRRELRVLRDVPYGRLALVVPGEPYDLRLARADVVLLGALVLGGAAPMAYRSLAFALEHLWMAQAILGSMLATVAYTMWSTRWNLRTRQELAVSRAVAGRAACAGDAEAAALLRARALEEAVDACLALYLVMLVKQGRPGQPLPPGSATFASDSGADDAAAFLSAAESAALLGEGPAGAAGVTAAEALHLLEAVGLARAGDTGEADGAEGTRPASRGGRAPAALRPGVQVVSPDEGLKALALA